MCSHHLARVVNYADNSTSSAKIFALRAALRAASGIICLSKIAVHDYAMLCYALVNIAMIAYDNNYIRVVDGVLDPEFCAHLISQFESCKKHHKEIPGKLIELDCMNTRHRAGTQLQMPNHSLWRTYDWTADTDRIMALIKPHLHDYRADWDKHNCLPNVYSAEGIRIKCYRPGVHEFKLHIDQGTRESSSRFIAVLMYLNDSEAGTEFPLEGYTVAARTGRIVMFSPSWQFPHRGLMPQDSTKYIMSTYLHFIPEHDYK